MTSASLPSSPSKAAAYLPQLDGFRGLAALYVLLFHVVAGFGYFGEPLPDAISGLRWWLSHGHAAVSTFIVLSGFCLMLPIARAGEMRLSAPEFFRRRALRILPTYYAALLVSLCLTPLFSPHSNTSFDSYLPVTLKGVLLHLPLLHDLSHHVNVQINGPFWSLGVEWRIYFFFPFIVWAWFRWGWRLTLTLSVLTSALLTKVLLLPGIAPHINSQNNGCTPQYLGLFTLGMLGATIAFSNDRTLSCWRERLSWLWMTTFSGGAMLVALNWHHFCAVIPDLTRLPVTRLIPNPVPLYTSDVLIGVWAASLLVTVCHGTTEKSGFASWLLSRTILVRLGEFGFSIYLMHMPFLQLIWQYALVPLFPDRALLRCALLALVGAPVAVAGCYGFHLLFERPIARWRGARAMGTNPAAHEEQ